MTTEFGGCEQLNLPSNRGRPLYYRRGTERDTILLGSSALNDAFQGLIGKLFPEFGANFIFRVYLVGFLVLLGGKRALLGTCTGSVLGRWLAVTSVNRQAPLLLHD
jgi:hypothetical protein